MFSRMVLAIGTAALATVAAGCGGGDASARDDRVVAAFYPLAYAAERVGSGISITNLTPPGAEPHDLELTAGDVGAIRDAKLVLYLGNGFQAGLEKAVADRDGASLDLLADQELLRAAGEHELDPHVWLDPIRFAQMAREIAGALGDESAADELVSELEQLDAELEQGLATCTRRQLVTSHAAFGYLADRYDLEQIPLAGLSPETEPSAKDLAALADDVEKEGATTVFFETLVSPKLAETVAREAGAKTAVLNPIEGLTGDQLADGEDYFSVMRENLAVLREALGCT
ncbi:MAG: metal ABC transporter substrate-binding protein [Gaiellales bacterium]